MAGTGDVDESEFGGVLGWVEGVMGGARLLVCVWETRFGRGRIGLRVSELRRGGKCGQNLYVDLRCIHE